MPLSFRYLANREDAISYFWGNGKKAAAGRGKYDGEISNVAARVREWKAGQSDSVIILNLKVEVDTGQIAAAIADGLMNEGIGILVPSSGEDVNNSDCAEVATSAIIMASTGAESKEMQQESNAFLNKAILSHRREQNRSYPVIWIRKEFSEAKIRSEAASESREVFGKSHISSYRNTDRNSSIAFLLLGLAFPCFFSPLLLLIYFTGVLYEIASSNYIAIVIIYQIDGTVSFLFTLSATILFARSFWTGKRPEMVRSFSFIFLAVFAALNIPVLGDVNLLNNVTIFAPLFTILNGGYFGTARIFAVAVVAWWYIMFITAIFGLGEMHMRWRAGYLFLFASSLSVLILGASVFELNGNLAFSAFWSYVNLFSVLALGIIVSTTCFMLVGRNMVISREEENAILSRGFSA